MNQPYLLIKNYRSIKYGLLCIVRFNDIWLLQQVWEMYKQSSLGRLSSRSLSKIRTKIETAFGKAINNQNTAKNKQQFRPSRSNSVKSLANSKIENGQKFIPFSTALKNGLLQPHPKSSSHQIINSSSRKRLTDFKEESISNRPEFNSKQRLITCNNNIKNQVIAGYGWYHQQGKQLASVSKKNKQSLLRYFAIKQKDNQKKSKIILAAIEDSTLYVGNKKHIAIRSDSNTLINSAEASKVSLQNVDFVLVINEFMISCCNLNKLIGEVYELISDGVLNMDALANILGRRISQLVLKSGKNCNDQLFILVIIVQNRLSKLKGIKS